MRKKGDGQFSLDLHATPTGTKNTTKEALEENAAKLDERHVATVLSLTDKREEKERYELDRHYKEILKLVQHFN